MGMKNTKTRSAARALFLATGLLALALPAQAGPQKGGPAQDSVYSWGPWATLAPAAGREPLRFGTGDLVPELRPEDSSQLTPALSQVEGTGGSPGGGEGGSIPGVHPVNPDQPVRTGGPTPPPPAPPPGS